ncbi:MAG: fasciclin domain-containing protein [Rhodospirillales bacterium]|nr:fasciclin domain-containing protein [Rhodospirillales bacterium]
MKIAHVVPMTLAASLLAACSQGMAQSAAMPAGAMTASNSSETMTVTVGGAPMYASKTIVANAVNSKDHTTLVAAVKAAGLVATLEGPGPFTVFAPTNAAFAALPAGTVPALLKPANKPTLTKVLTYHVVPGKLDYADLVALIQKGGGSARLTTVEGGTLTIMMNGMHNIDVKDAKGDVAQITTYDVNQSNGVIQVIDKVMLPG